MRGQLSDFFWSKMLAARRGIEPRSEGPKPSVLPLHHRATSVCFGDIALTTRVGVFSHRANSLCRLIQVDRPTNTERALCKQARIVFIPHALLYAVDRWEPKLERHSNEPAMRLLGFDRVRYSSREERRYESAMLRTLGATRRRVLTGVATEFIAIGLLSGVLASVGASIAGWLIAGRIFDLEYHFSVSLWLAGPLIGMVFVGLSGILATHRVVTHAPVSVLREG